MKIPLREKRDLLFSDLKNILKDEKIPGTQDALTFDTLDLGSYSMKTGIKPTKDDYDIDLGVIFNISNEDYDSNQLKKLVFDGLNKQHNRTVEFNRPCITVKYSTGYHVDLAIYSNNNGDPHIAWGKQHSTRSRCWWEADPIGLKNWVNNVSNDQEHRRQFRRVVRYLKKWKSVAFNGTGNSAPPSIGLTIQARRAFQFNSSNDLEPLITIVRAIKSAFFQTVEPNSKSLVWSIDTQLPVRPYKNVYYKMTPAQQDVFYRKIDSLLEALISARDEESEHEASKIFIKIFGPDFPLVEDSLKTKTPPYVVTGNNA